MKIFAVELSVVTVIAADDRDEAVRQAKRWKRDIIDDEPAPSIHITREVTCKGDLPSKWKGDCIPYGDGSDSSIDEILSKKP